MDGSHTHGTTARWTLVLLGWILGTALQLQQALLWGSTAYALLVLAGALLWRWRVRAAACVAAALLAFGSCGWRANVFLDDALAPSLEGRDVALQGVVAAMPQPGDLGPRFRFAVESARLDGAPVRVPPLLALGWYGNRDSTSPASEVPPLRAGERWRFTARLKAPHGSRNPHGFDYELWLWEQGVQATGYVRTTADAVVPMRLGDSGLHPLEAARQRVRDAIFTHIVDRQQAGVVAALVTGDQNAIDRTDWDVFRATGVAHLMRFSGSFGSRSSNSIATAVPALRTHRHTRAIADISASDSGVRGISFLVCYASAVDASTMLRNCSRISGGCG